MKELRKKGTGVNINTYVTVCVYISMHYLFLHVYSDGPKNHDTGKTGAAFYIPEVKVQGGNLMK